MAKKNQLELLIRSLTPAELKRFTFYTKTYASDKSYLQLFKEIRNNTHKRPEKYNNKYAQNRKYLYRTILESLIVKNKDKSPEAEVLFLIKSARFLINKQLPNQAYSVINRALQIVAKQEMIGFHLELIALEKEVRLYTNPKSYRSDAEIIAEEKRLIGMQSQLLTLKLIYNHILTYKKQYGYIDEILWNRLKNEVEEMGMPQSESECLTVKARYYYYFNNTLLNWIRHKHKTAYDFSKNFLQINTTSLTRIEYLNGVLEHSSSAVCLGKPLEVLDILTMVKQRHEKGSFGSYDNIALKIFYYRSNYELMSYVFMGEKENVAAKLKEIELGLQKWGEKIPLEMKLILASVLKLGYVAVKDYRKAAKQIALLVNNYKSGLRLDAYEDGLISNLIYIFVKDDSDYLETFALKAYKHFLKHENKDNLDVDFKIKTAKLFLEYARGRYSHNELLHKFRYLLENKMRYFDNRFSEIDYPYLIWVNSLILKKDLLTTAAEMAKERLNL